MKQVATVKKVIKLYISFGIYEVKNFLNDDNIIVFKDSWASKIKDDLNKNLWISVSTEIEFLMTKFRNYEEADDKYKEKGGG